MNESDLSPRMELCSHCDRYNCVNDPSVSDLIAGTHECRHCGKRFEMRPLFRANEAAKIDDRLDALERAVFERGKK